MEPTTTIDPKTKTYLTYGLAGTAIALIITGIFVPSAREYLVLAAKFLLTTAGMSVQ